jgi:hypothetical protein
VDSCGQDNENSGSVKGGKFHTKEEYSMESELRKYLKDLEWEASTASVSDTNNYLQRHIDSSVTNPSLQLKGEHSGEMVGGPVKKGKKRKRKNIKEIKRTQGEERRIKEIKMKKEKRKKE